MLDFAHQDRIAPRRAPQSAELGTGRFVFPAGDLRHGTASREAWVLAIKAQIEAGEYPLEEKLDGAMEKMIVAAH